MLTALTVALTFTAGLTVAWWRMRRALTAVQAERRITDAAVARDHSANVAQLMAGVRRYRNEQAVLAAADAIVTAALAQHAQHRNGDPS